MSKDVPVTITIKGPAGSGKSAIGQCIALSLTGKGACVVFEDADTLTADAEIALKSLASHEGGLHVKINVVQTPLV